MLRGSRRESCNARRWSKGLCPDRLSKRGHQRPVTTSLQGSSASQATAGTGSHRDPGRELQHGKKFDRLGIHHMWQKGVVTCTGNSANMEWASPRADVDTGAKAHMDAGTSWIKLDRSGSCVVGIERTTVPTTSLSLTQTN